MVEQRETMMSSHHSPLDDVILVGEVVLRPAVGGVQVQRVHPEVELPELRIGLHVGAGSEVPGVEDGGPGGGLDNEHHGAGAVVGLPPLSRGNPRTCWCFSEMSVRLIIINACKTFRSGIFSWDSFSTSFRRAIEQERRG